ncbi:MAG: hypothetical protein IKG15_07020 [Solobacterium sp.]|nr:hypothetical protein [Solobacterium sp.]
MKDKGIEDYVKWLHSQNEKLDFDQMTQNVIEDRAARDKKSVDGFNRMSEEAKAEKNQWNELFSRAVVENKNRAAEMQNEINHIQDDADKRIKDVKEKYADHYGRQSWNSSLDDCFRDVAKGIKRNE